MSQQSLFELAPLSPQERRLVALLREGAVLVDRRGSDGKRNLISARTHVLADRLEQGPRAHLWRDE